MFTQVLKQTYKSCFNVEVKNPDFYKYVPSKVCATCAKTLRNWMQGTRSFSFENPMIWKEQKDHETDCYFCLTNVVGFNRRNKNCIKYLDIESAKRPEDKSGNSIPENLTEVLDENLNENEAETEVEDNNNDDEDFFDVESLVPLLINQKRLNDLCRDLTLTKEKSELLSSRLKEWNLLADDTKI